MIKEMVEKYNYDYNVKEKVDKMLTERRMAKAIVTENKHAQANFNDISRQKARFQKKQLKLKSLHAQHNAHENEVFVREKAAEFNNRWE